ncbi:MAG TPA: hypothetical protein VGE07_03915 [Herpetosiphonaceae bacterium]
MEDRQEAPRALRRRFGAGASCLWTIAAWAGVCGLWVAPILIDLALGDTGSQERYYEWRAFWTPAAQTLFRSWLLALGAYALLRGIRRWRPLDVLIILACMLATFLWVTSYS